MALPTTSMSLTRQACDRCRKHKLRCTRAGDVSECDRCLRKGTQCTHSSVLPKGRRSSTSGDLQAECSSELTNGSPDTGSQSPGVNWEDFQLDPGQVESVLADSAFDRLSAMDTTQLPDMGSILFNVAASSSTASTGSQDEGPIQMMDAESGRGGINHAGNNNEGPENLIAQLAQLSTHISSLRRSDCILTEGSASSPFSLHMQSGSHIQTLQAPFEDAVFQAFTTWLSRGPADRTPSWPLAPAPKITTIGDVLYHIFSASHYLLELLQYTPMSSALNNAFVSNLDFNPDLAGFTVPSMNMDGSTYLGYETGQALTWKSQSSSINDHHGIVVRHLLIANHTMLLGIYSEMLTLLQRCASPGIQEGKALLNDMRLVSVVQLCSYLIHRQHQAVSWYLSSCISCLPESESFPDTTATDAMENMKKEAGQLIQRLKSMLQV